MMRGLHSSLDQVEWLLKQFNACRAQHCAAALLLGFSIIGSPCHGREVSIVDSTGLWGVVDKILGFQTVDPARIESGLPLKFEKSGEDEVKTFYDSPPFILSDRIAVSTMRLHVPRSRNHPGFIHIEIDATHKCMTLSDVQKKYPAAWPIATPHGLIEKGITALAMDSLNGKLVFSFGRPKAECLYNIFYDPLRPSLKRDSVE